MNQAKAQAQIVQQQLALDSYLRTLLEDVPEADSPAVQAKTVVHSVAPPRSQLETDSIVKAAVVDKKPAVFSPATDVVNLEKPTKLQALSIMPEWSQQEFSALFFKVDKLILATPLTELLRTIKIEQSPTKIPGQPDWFLGLLDEHDARIGVLDTGQLILGKTRGGKRDLQANPFKRILITRDKRWGLACDEILAIGKVSPEKVRWRTQRQKRPWLIGTAIEELTAIVDVRQLVPHRRHD